MHHQYVTDVARHDVSHFTVLLLFNRNTTGPANITAAWADVGLPPDAEMVVRDLWAARDLGTFRAAFTAEAEEHRDHAHDR